MAPVGAPVCTADALLNEADKTAHMRQLINNIKPMLKHDAPAMQVLIAQASMNPEEQGWLFAAMMRQEDWPQGMDSYIELGKQLLGAIAANANGVKSTTLTLCAHDPFEASNALAKPRKATEEGAMCTIEVPDLNLKIGQGFLMVEGCVRTKDPHLTAHHVRLGIKEALGPLLQTTGIGPESLTMAGPPPKRPTSAIDDGCRVLPVRVPQLWEDLVKFAHGKEVLLNIMEGGQVQAHLPASKQDTSSLPLTPENRSRAKITSPLHDPDGCAGLEHPVALKIFQFLISDFKSKEWCTAIQCRQGIMRMT